MRRSTSSTPDSMEGAPRQHENQDNLAQHVIQLALNVPHAHLTDVGSWHPHVPFAYALTAIHKPRKLVELGVHKGDSYLTFCHALIDHVIDGKAIGVDTWQGDAHAGQYDGDIVLKGLKRRHDAEFGACSKLLRKTFDEALDDVTDGSVDLLHIDGLHTYEAVKHDFDSWAPKLSNRAIVLFHDTAVRKDDFGVWKFWEEVSQGRDAYEFPYGNGLGVLVVGDHTEQDTRNLLRLLRDDYQLSGLSVRQLLARISLGLANEKSAAALRNDIRQLRKEWLKERAAALAERDRINQAWQAERVAVSAERERLGKERAVERMYAQARIDSLEAMTGLGRTRPLSIIYGLFHAIAAAKVVALKLFARVLHAPDNVHVEKARGRIDSTDTSADDTAAADIDLESLNETLVETPEPPVGAASHPGTRSRPGRLSFMATVQNATRVGGRSLINALPITAGAKVQLKYTMLAIIGPLFGVDHNRLRHIFGSLTSNTDRLKAVGERYLPLAATARGTPADRPPRTVSIVVPVYNQIRYTLACLDAIKANTTEIDYEVIVVDDGSTDATQDTLSARNDIVYLRNEKNLGFIGSCNAGAQIARNTYVCFLNNDTTVLPFWLSALVNTFELHEHVGLVGSKLLYPDGRLQEAGGIVWSDGSAWNWGRLNDPNDSRFTYARLADYCSGASIVVPRALFSSLNGFDAHYAPAYGEDSDLAFKVRALGLSTIYQPLSQVVHFEGITSGTDTSEGAKKHQIANAAKLAKRWAPALEHQGTDRDADILVDRGVLGHILVLDQITPEPDHDAGSITALELMRGLSDLGFKVTFAPCSNLCDMPLYTDLLSAVGIESTILPWVSSVKKHLIDRGWIYDAVLIFRPKTWHEHVADVRRFAPQAKVIYHVSDLHYLREHRANQIAGSSCTHAKNDAGTKESELNLVSSADLSIVHSSVEQKVIEQERPGTQAICFPWIYEIQGRGSGFEERSGVVFLGGYRHPPNVDAVAHYVADIHPLIKEDLAEPVTFTAAGSFPPSSLTDLECSDVVIPGYVEDIAPVLFEARVMAVPLRYGAGIKGKILSAMAHGLPVVTTAIGAEGMELADGENVLISDSPAEFAAAVCRLYRDSKLWHRLQQGGLTYIERHTSRDVGLSILADALQRLGLPFLKRPRPGGRDNNKGTSLFGSPPIVSDVGSLLDAGSRMLPDVHGLDLVVLPLGVSLPETGPLPFHIDKVVTCPHLAEHLPAANAIVAIVDSTDSESVRELCQSLDDGLAAGAACAVVFAPPRMTSSTSGYTIRAPFVDRSVDNIELPVNAHLAQHFQFSNCSVEWRTDQTLTGFSSLAILRVSRRAAHSL